MRRLKYTARDRSTAPDPLHRLQGAGSRLHGPNEPSRVRVPTRAMLNRDTYTPAHDWIVMGWLTAFFLAAGFGHVIAGLWGAIAGGGTVICLLLRRHHG